MINHEQLKKEKELLDKNWSYHLLRGRIGEVSQPEFIPNALQTVNLMAGQLRYYGGLTQQQRMIRDKRKTLDRVVLYSYQGAFVKKYYNEEIETLDGVREQPPVRALINPNKVKQDYDEKIISIGYEHNFKTGDVFEWCNTNTYWLIYLQDMTELAYFRGEIRRCRYQIKWLDEENKPHSTYAAIRGPVETKIDFIQKHKISVDEPNHSLNILIPKNEDTLKYFKRYTKFYLQNDFICWRVEAIDWISTPDILEINATEYYSNEFEDEVDKGLVGSLIIDEPKENDNDVIVGDNFIKPKRKYTYYCNNNSSNWKLNPKLPIKYSINEEDNSITLEWKVSYTGQFDLTCDDYTKTIVVESLF